VSLEQRIEHTTAALRDAFDGSFAKARATEGVSFDDFVSIRIAGDPYVVRLSEIASLHADCNIVGIPSPMPELFGIAGFRGKVAPVYDLGALLGYARAQAPRWLMLVRASQLIGLAFERFDAYLHIPTATVSSIEAAKRASPFVAGVVGTGDGPHSVIHVASLLEALTKRLSGQSPSKEQ